MQTTQITYDPDTGKGFCKWNNEVRNGRDAFKEMSYIARKHKLEKILDSFTALNHKQGITDREQIADPALWRRSSAALPCPVSESGAFTDMFEDFFAEDFSVL